MSTKLSATQLDTLRRMAADTGRIERTKGGFWITPNTPPGDHGFAYKWWASVLTIRAMEKRGLIERTRELVEEWRDPRRITAAGLAEVAAVAEESIEAAAVEVRKDWPAVASMLRAKHVKVDGTLTALGLGDEYECVACRVAWPCDVAMLLAVLP